LQLDECLFQAADCAQPSAPGEMIEGRSELGSFERLLSGTIVRLLPDHLRVLDDGPVEVVALLGGLPGAHRCGRGASGE
jgi:hypothetical protein